MYIPFQLAHEGDIAVAAERKAKPNEFGCSTTFATSPSELCQAK